MQTHLRKLIHTSPVSMAAAHADGWNDTSLGRLPELQLLQPCRTMADPPADCPVSGSGWPNAHHPLSWHVRAAWMEVPFAPCMWVVD